MESSPEVRRTNPDKLMWPADGMTKQDLISYYEAVSKVLVEELRGKPLTVIRAPDGIEGFRFFQKQAPDSTPDWIETVSFQHRPRAERRFDSFCATVQRRWYGWRARRRSSCM